MGGWHDKSLRILIKIQLFVFSNHFFYVIIIKNSFFERWIMKEYKVIPCPGRIIIEKKGTALTGLNIYKEIIDQETIGGWELVTSMTSEAVVKGKKKQTGR